MLDSSRNQYAIQSLEIQMQMIHHEMNIRNPEETPHAIQVSDVTDDYGFTVYVAVSKYNESFKAANRFLFPGRYPHLEV